MPIRVPVGFNPIVRRGAKNVRAVHDQPFDFTAEEIAEFEQHHPQGLRRPINEVTSVAGNRPYRASPDPVPTPVAPDPEYHLNEEADDDDLESGELDEPVVKTTKTNRVPPRTARGR